VQVQSTQSLLFTSGQLAIDRQGNIPEGVCAQSALCFSNIDAILAEAGGSCFNVLKVNAFVTDRSHMAGYMKERDAWLSEVVHLPASTLMIVSGFTKPEFLVEIEVIAALPSSS